MSRIGKKPVAIPANVKLTLEHLDVRVEGPKGKLQFKLNSRVKAVLKDKEIIFSRLTGEKRDGALQGTSRSIVFNMIKGVTEGYAKELAIEGVGFKASLQGKTLSLLLGFTHPIIFQIPEGLTVEVPKPTVILVKGIDKAQVGLFSAKIHKTYEAEPYKGKGVRYLGEHIRRKAGKTVTK